MQIQDSTSHDSPARADRYVRESKVLFKVAGYTDAVRRRQAGPEADGKFHTSSCLVSAHSMEQPCPATPLAFRVSVRTRFLL